MDDQLKEVEQIINRALAAEKLLKKYYRMAKKLQPEMPNHIGLNSFKTHWTSEPEHYVLEKEKRYEQFSNCDFTEERIDTE